MAERIERYLETAGAQVRWKRVRPALERELRTHLEEQTEAYLAEGMTEDAAEAEAVRQMGDAETVGLALDAVHRPKRQTAILLFAGLAIVLGMYLRAKWIGSSYAFALASGLLACGALPGGYYLDYRCLSRYAWYIYGAVLVLGAVCVYQTTFMGPGAPRMLGITVGDTSEYAALLYPAAYALVVYALQGKKGGFWLSLAAVAPFALPFLWDRYVGILPQLLFAVRGSCSAECDPCGAVSGEKELRAGARVGAAGACSCGDFLSGRTAVPEFFRLVFQPRRSAGVAGDFEGILEKFLHDFRSADARHFGGSKPAWHTVRRTCMGVARNAVCAAGGAARDVARADGEAAKSAWADAVHPNGHDSFHAADAGPFVSDWDLPAVRAAAVHLGKFVYRHGRGSSGSGPVHPAPIRLPGIGTMPRTA